LKNRFWCPQFLNHPLKHKNACCVRVIGLLTT
jgi:hypothetical protein